MVRHARIRASNRVCVCVSTFVVGTAHVRKCVHAPSFSVQMLLFGSFWNVGSLQRSGVLHEALFLAL